ncbi:DDB1- and CUL4-associated factor 4 [Merluccius polli]|uniref:DDB1- and CUL4-associated factor 4 n=1 Tax=Merluccius polli TaxID=89951 RepID=A0AA47NAD8_MERPO|nr:DDB1- and CUL4-associated factor 4 [Merluccius polli]
MKKWNWREERRSRRRHGGHHRHDWYNDNRHRASQDEWYGDNQTDSSHQAAHRTSDAALPSSSSSSASPSSSSSTSNTAPELPGFYFDPEKNRYFRLLPGHNNCNPLTKEQLQEKEREKQRSRLLSVDDQPRKMAPRVGLNTALLLQKRRVGLLPGSSYCSNQKMEKSDKMNHKELQRGRKQSINIKNQPNIVINYGNAPCVTRLVHEVKASGMMRHRLEVQSTDNRSPNRDNFRVIVGDSASERVFTVNDVSHGGCKYGIMNFKGCSRGSLSVEMCDNLYFTNRKVNSICWASVNHPDSHVLLCLVGMADTPGCVSLLPASLFSNSNPEQPGMLCSFKISTAWSCAWCLNPQADKSFSTGLSRRVIVKDAETGRTQTYSVASDVLAQQFALRAPVLFNGCRSGEIFSIDLRQRSRRDHSWKSSRFHQESAITSVRLLQDENYLLAADMLGQIKLWDVRVSKPVQEYKGHHNEHAYLPIHVNEAEGLLLAVGQDCYTRLWSLRDGQLLRTIPSPHPAAKDLIPSVVFSSQLGGRRGLPGLLMAVKHDLYYFSYNTDHQEMIGEPVQ